MAKFPPQETETKEPEVPAVSPPAAEPVEAAPEPFLKIEEEKRVLTPKEEYIEKILAERNKPKPEVPPPPPMTARQKTQLELEQEAGRKRQAYFEEQRKIAPPPPAEELGKLTPVMRPSDYTHETKPGAGKFGPR